MSNIPPRKRPGLARAALMLLALLLAAAAVVVGPYVFERNDYRTVASIEGRADFR